MDASTFKQIRMILGLSQDKLALQMEGCVNSGLMFLDL